jgi:hypothetical protein
LFDCLSWYVISYWIPFLQVLTQIQAVVSSIQSAVYGYEGALNKFLFDVRGCRLFLYVYVRVVLSIQACWIIFFPGQG